MIQFQNVAKRYKDNDFSIDSLSFRIDPGEFVFLIGPSGSGKTTVIKLLIREELPTEGNIYFDDFDITRLSRNSVYKLRRQLGVVFQDYKLIPDKTVWENVAFAMEVAGKSNKEIEETVPYLLDIVGLTQRAKAFPDHLSGGEKQRVAIARAVSNNPRVLIADEPTGNLDPGAAWDIVQILSKINNWGTTVIMSTHGSDIVNTLNKRVIQMAGGKIIRDDSKGFYEHSHVSDPDDQQEAEEIFAEQQSEQRKGPIKVNLKKEAVEAETPRKLFGFLPIRNRLQQVADNEEEPEIDDGAVEGTALITDKDKGDLIATETLGLAGEKPSAAELAAETEERVAQVIQAPVQALDLPPEVEADLEMAGYQTVDEIVNDGPEALTKKLTIDPEEAVMVAESIEKLVAEAGVDVPQEPSPTKHKTTKSKKPKEEVIHPEAKKEAKATKIKVDLTAKRKKQDD